MIIFIVEIQFLDVKRGHILRQQFNNIMDERVIIMRYISTILILSLSLCTLGLTGCFSSNPKDIEVFLRPRDVNVVPENYVLQPPDGIEIHCTNVPEIHMQRQRIRPDGKVSFETLGEIEVAGKTPKEIAEVIKEKVTKLYTIPGENPIDVRVFAYLSKVYYVLGQVSRPGVKDYTGRDTVFTALSEALPTTLAWEQHIQVIRPSEDTSVKPKIFEVNFDRMSVHGDTSKDVLLQEGDIIYVPPTILASISMVLEEFLRPIARAFSGAYMLETGPDRTSRYYGRGY
jgi:protein involved in polysaccharide export with SLBB domain